MLLLKTLLFTTVVALSATFNGMVQARPNGAPFCAASEEKLTAAMGAPTGDRTFRIEVASPEYTPGQPMSIKITSANPDIKTYKGLLLYVMPAADNQKRVGTFAIPADHKSNVPNCGAIQAEVDSVITHTSPSDKPLGTEIMWTAPADFDGDLIVRAAVVGTGPSNWQIVEQVPLTKRAAGDVAAAGGNPGYKRKCKKFRSKTGNTGTGYGSGGYGTDQGATGSEGANAPSETNTPADSSATNGDGTADAGTDPSSGSSDSGTTDSGSQSDSTSTSDSTAAAQTDVTTDADGNQIPAGEVEESTTAGAMAGVSISSVSTLAALVVAVVALSI